MRATYRFSGLNPQADGFYYADVDDRSGLQCMSWCVFGVIGPAAYIAFATDAC